MPDEDDAEYDASEEDDSEEEDEEEDDELEDDDVADVFVDGMKNWCGMGGPSKASAISPLSDG